MNSKQVKSGKAMSMPGGLAYGVLISGIITVVSSIILAKLLDLEKMKWDSIGYGIMIMLLIASFLGALIASEKIKRQRFVVCLSAGGLYLLLLLSITALFFGGQYEAVGVTAGLIFAGSMCAALLNLRDRKGRSKQIRRIHR